MYDPIHFAVMESRTKRRIQSAIEQADVSISDLESILPLFNDFEWHNRISKLVGLAKSYKDDFLASESQGVVDDYLDLIGIINCIEIPIPEIDTSNKAEKLKFLDRFRTARGFIGNLRIDADNIVKKCIECGIVPIQLDSDYFSHLFIKNHKNDSNIKEITNSANNLQSILNKQISPAMGELDSEKREKINTYITGVSKNVNTINISISIGEGFDLAVIERAALSIKKGTEEIIKTVRPWTGKISSKIRRGINNISIPLNKMISTVQSIFKSSAINIDGSDVQIDPDTKQNFSDETNKVTAGLRLRIARNKMKLSLSDVSYRTRIPQRYIIYLEESNYKLLPRRVYILGYARLLAKLFDEDPDEIAELIKLDLQA